MGLEVSLRLHVARKSLMEGRFPLGLEINHRIAIQVPSSRVPLRNCLMAHPPDPSQIVRGTFSLYLALKIVSTCTHVIRPRVTSTYYVSN